MSDFEANARDELVRLKSHRAQHRRALEEIDQKIAGLEQFLGTVTTTILVGKNITIRRKPGPRGRKLLTILSILENAVPDGLGFDDIIARAKEKGVDLLRPSLRSQLSKARSKGVVKYADGLYYHPSALPEAAPTLPLDEVSNEAEAPADTGASETSDNPGIV